MPPGPFALAKTAAAARKLGCASASRACLANKSVAEVLNAQGLSPTPGVNDEQVLPTVDGVSLPDDTLTILRAGQGANVPILLGANTNDATLFVVRAGARSKPVLLTAVCWPYYRPPSTYWLERPPRAFEFHWNPTRASTATTSLLT